MGQLPFMNISNASKVLGASGGDAMGANDGRGNDDAMDASDVHDDDAMDASDVHGDDDHDGDRGDDDQVYYQT